MRPFWCYICFRPDDEFVFRQHGVARILGILSNYFGPEAADATHQQVTRFMEYRLMYQSIDEFVAKFDLLRRKAGSKMEMGAGFPEQFVSILRTNNAGLPTRRNLW